ncbi:co-chaperone GroES [candidate division KSB1 bacterium]|nr:co-chaperone GroES [Phycisphaerae bacterium]NIV95785.1 co-chaperone GroES [candidate division KSB1 bacterium]
MAIKPTSDYVLVRRIEPETVSPGGIYIPEQARERKIEAEVLAVGSGKILSNGNVRKPCVKEGDRILLAKFSGIQIDQGDESTIMIGEGDILAIIE